MEAEPHHPRKCAAGPSKPDWGSRGTEGFFEFSEKPKVTLTGFLGLTTILSLQRLWVVTCSLCMRQKSLRCWGMAQILRFDYPQICGGSGNGTHVTIETYCKLAWTPRFFSSKRSSFFRKKEALGSKFSIFQQNATSLVMHAFLPLCKIGLPLVDH